VQLPVDVAGLIYLELFNLVDEATVFGDPTSAVPGERALAAVRDKLFPGGRLAPDDQLLTISLSDGDWALVQSLLEVSPQNKGRRQSDQERRLHRKGLDLVKARSQQLAEDS